MAVSISMTFTSLAMDQPLNRAHEEERKGYSYLQTCRWDDAEKSFVLAAKLMRKAMQDVTSVKILQPLQMQADKFEHMKNVIDIKKKEYSKSLLTDTPRKSSGLDITNTRQEMSGPSPVMEEVSNNNHSDLTSVDAPTFESVGTDTLTTATNHTAQEKRNNTIENKWQIIDIQQLIDDRETDSLLQVLMRSPEHEQDPLSASCKKIPKNLESKIEEYQEQNDILRDVAHRLVKALESTEKENRSLKQINKSLQDEISSITDRLMMFDETPSPLANCTNQNDSHEFSAGEPGVDPMINSIIFQPESFFEFKEREKDVMTELLQATSENLDAQKKEVESVPRVHDKQTHHNLSKRERTRKTHNYTHCEYIDNSIKYEDLDDGSNCEVSQIVSNLLSETESDNTPQRSFERQHMSIAGLPPLSPVHFVADDKDIVFAQRYRDDLCGKLS